MADLSFSQGSDPVSIFNDQSGNQLVIDSSGNITANIQASGTALTATGSSLNTNVTNSTLAVTQSGTWTTGRTWTLASGTDSVSAVQSGTWTVQPGNTANTTPWLVTDSSDGSVTPGTVAGKASLAGGQYNTTLPSLTTGQQVSLQVDSEGRLITSPGFGNTYFHPIYTLRVQTVTNNNSAASTTLATTIKSTSAGNMIVVTASSTSGTLTCTDSASQTYTTATNITSGTSHSYVFYVANTAAGVTSVTITDGTSTSLNMIVSEYSNISSSPLDKTSTNTNTGVSSWTSNSTVATTAANELLIGSATAIQHNATTFSAGTSWTSTNSIASGVGGANLVTFQEEQYVASTSTYAATGTTSGNDNELAAIATFKVSSYPTGFIIPNSATVIKSSAGSLSHVTINTSGTGSASLILYDGTSTSGTVIANINLTAAPNSLVYDLNFSTGLTAVINSISADFTIAYS